MATLVFKASGMLLIFSSDATIFLRPDHDLALVVISVIIPVVVSAASEAELAGIHINARAAIATQNSLLDLGYPQYKTPILTDNSTAQGIAHHAI